MSAKNKQMFKWTLCGPRKEDGIIEMSLSELGLLKRTLKQRGYGFINEPSCSFYFFKEDVELHLGLIVADTIPRQLLKWRRLP